MQRGARAPRAIAGWRVARGARLLVLIPLLMGSQAFAALNLTAGCTTGGNTTALCLTANMPPDGCSSTLCQPCGQTRYLVWTMFPKSKPMIPSD
jgi:hypothetical protein